jgi:acyl-CoA dehydrogenase
MSDDHQQDVISESFERLLQEICTPKTVREIEREGIGESSAVLWQKLDESGFVDALVPEAKGGSGLTLAGVHGLLENCGRHALPLPLGETMIARALLAATGYPVPSGPIALGCAVQEGSDLICRLTPYARTADFALLAINDKLVLFPCVSARRALLAPNAGAGELRWPAAMLRSALDMPAGASMLHAQASVLAAQIAGALSQVLSMTLGYANERVQFGKPIGKFQAVQHQIAVMAEHTAMARMAARIGNDSPSHLPDKRRAAIAKSVTSEAAASVASLGHALHGAIGMTEEYDLQLYTRRLHEWRLCAGTESYWNRELGATLVQARDNSMLDFVRASVL